MAAGPAVVTGGGNTLARRALEFAEGGV